jgi:hypothetical protein
MDRRWAVAKNLMVALLVLGFAAIAMTAAEASSTPKFPAIVARLSQVPGSGAFAATSCTSASHCVAVGNDGNGQPLVLAGDPSSWGAAQAEQITLGSSFGRYNNLDAITCTSTSYCVAVGSDGNGQPLVLAGDPSSWGVPQAEEITLGSSFGSGGNLDSITCSSAIDCVAVGSDGNSQPLALAGDPSSWGAAQAEEITLSSSFGRYDNGGNLDSIACTSADYCVAVGYDSYGRPLALAGDPSSWGAAQAEEITLGSSVGPGGNLNSITCSSASYCVAVGSDNNSQPLVLAGDPSSWGVPQAEEVTLGSSFGSGGYLDSITCSSAGYCVAVGSDGNYYAGNNQPLVLAGDPSSWSGANAKQITLGKAFGSSGSLDSITCTSASYCVAVGSDGNGSDGNVQPIVLAGDPSSWSLAQAREIGLKGSKFGAAVDVQSLACASASACFAVWSNGLLAGDPSSWGAAQLEQITLGSSFGSNGGGLNSITCTSASYCVAVGSDGHNQPLVLAGDPSSWSGAKAKQVTLGKAFGSDGNDLNSITCTSASYCVAVGSDGNNQPLVLAGDPSSWSGAQAKQITLGKAFGSDGWLNTVACPSRSYCVAVGIDGNNQPLVLAGDPSSWSGAQAKQITLGKAFGSGGWLNTVACPSRSYCVAAGNSGGFESASSPEKPLVLTGDPSSWAGSRAFSLSVPTATPTTVGGFSAGLFGIGFLSSVSCENTTYCVVVGGDGAGAPLYLTGNPAQWEGQSLVRPSLKGSPFSYANITGSYCDGTACFAAGNSNAGDYIVHL